MISFDAVEEFRAEVRRAHQCPSPGSRHRRGVLAFRLVGPGNFRTEVSTSMMISVVAEIDGGGP